MSAIPVLEVARSPRRDHRDHIELRPRPIVVVQPRVVSTPKRKPLAITQIAIKAAMFVGIATFTYASSTLLGQVMVEKARRDGLQAITRVHQAEASELALQSRLQQLEGDQAISGWASDNKFVQADAQIQATTPKELVATNRD